MKKHLLMVTLLAIAVMCLSGCGNSMKTATAQKLSFAESVSIDSIKALDGKPVTITGYMATLSPLNGDYIYLMNLPYQSCPFCVPNTQQLANTMAVYAAKGTKFDYTDRPVKITGRMELGDFTDEYGYTYNYRIADAGYEVVDLSQVSSDYAMYQSLAEDGVIADVNSMFDYLLFVCQWTEYQGSGVDGNGQAACSCCVHWHARACFHWRPSGTVAPSVCPTPRRKSILLSAASWTRSKERVCA